MRSMAHTDQYDNLLCQIVGTKEVVLIPHTQRLYLYTTSTLSHETDSIYHNMPHHYSPIDFFEPDFKKYPDFAKVKGKYTVTINSGDILYIPAHWFHYVKSSEGPNFALNFFYSANYMDYLSTYFFSEN